MNKIIEIIEKVGMKKMCLIAHYVLAIFTALSFYILSIFATFLPSLYNITQLFHICKLVFIYVGIVVAYITILCIFEKMQTMNKPRSKFDFIAFFIGFSIFVTLGLIVTCIIFMFKKNLTQIEFEMWKALIKVFGGIFITEAGGGYIYNIFKKKFGINEKTDVVTDKVSEPDGEAI